jgi:hypothetical protein
MHQYISVSLSLLGLAGIVGAGVAVGSGIGLMSLSVLEEAEAEKMGATKAVAHSPAESRGSFAASGVAK